jgi:NitT/TauT family transport system substrate-binding protein
MNDPVPARHGLRAIASVALVALLCAVAPPAGAQQLTKIRVATLAIDVASQALYAKDQGFFEAEGLDADISLMNSGPAIASAVAGGSIDFGASNIVTMCNAYQRGVPYVLVAPGGAYTDTQPTSKLVVMSTSPIKTARDLTGKTIAVNALNSIDSVGAQAWIDKNGGDSKSVKFVEMPYSAMGAAVASGRVDVGSIDEPFVGDAIVTNSLRVIGLPLAAVAKRFIEGAFFSTTAYAQANPDTIRKFADAMAKAADWANANPDASAAILFKYSKRPLAPGAARTYFMPRFVRSEAQPLIDAAAKYGALKEAFPLSNMFAPGIVYVK